jgi:hypothetical protein
MKGPRPKAGRSVPLSGKHTVYPKQANLVIDPLPDRKAPRSPLPPRRPTTGK